jgi:hypothetical protein
MGWAHWLVGWPSQIRMLRYKNFTALKQLRGLFAIRRAFQTRLMRKNATDYSLPKFFVCSPNLTCPYVSHLSFSLPLFEYIYIILAKIKNI